MIFIFITICVLSIILGSIKYGSISSAYQVKEFKNNWQIKFFEIWNSSFNYFIAGLVAYYFATVRWPELSAGAGIELTDFGLLTVFMLGVFGHLAVLSKNITEGVNAILKRVLEK